MCIERCVENTRKTFDCSLKNVKDKVRPEPCCLNNGGTVASVPVTHAWDIVQQHAPYDNRQMCVNTHAEEEEAEGNSGTSKRANPVFLKNPPRCHQDTVTRGGSI